MTLAAFISVLAVACPGAFGSATHTAFRIAMGKGAENGILIKSGKAFEGAYRADTVVFVKTGVSDEICRAVLRRLHKMGIQGMMTDDHQKITAEIKKLQKKGRVVAVAGDAVRDKAALALADAAFSLGVNMKGSDIALMRSDLRDVPTAILLSRTTMRMVRANLFRAIGYNVVGIFIGAGLPRLFGGPPLYPTFAALAMSLCSLFILDSTLRLKKIIKI